MKQEISATRIFVGAIDSAWKCRTALEYFDKTTGFLIQHNCTEDIIGKPEKAIVIYKHKKTEYLIFRSQDLKHQETIKERL